ncbi:MAG: 30S ribosomal protein S8e [Candidatus Micrarchaeia archaeon]
MQQYHEAKQTKKKTGAKFARHRDKKLAHYGGHFASTKVSDTDVRVKARKRGGSKKIVALYAAYANVVMPDGKIKRAKIKSVLDSPNNPNYKRMNIITKGVIIETEVGKAKVTSRPGQDGVVNAKIVS